MGKQATFALPHLAVTILLLGSAGISIHAQQTTPIHSSAQASKESLPDASSSNGRSSSQTENPAEQASPSSQAEPSKVQVPPNPNAFITVLENTLLRKLCACGVRRIR